MSELRRKPLYSFFAESPNSGSVPARGSSQSSSQPSKERHQPKYYNPSNHTVHPSEPSAERARHTSQVPPQESRHHPAPFTQTSRRHFVPSGPAPQSYPLQSPSQTQYAPSQPLHAQPQTPQQPHQANGAGSSANLEELTRIFNSALVSSRAESLKDFSHELLGLVESPAYQALINAVRQLARSQGIGERESAEILIQTFRKLDRLWSDYVFQEGVDRLRGK